MRLKLTIAYDGRPFKGWQKQPNTITIEGAILEAIEKIAKQYTPITGSGRTDAGVHANEQVIHFNPPNSLQMNPYNWVPAINTKLPASIRVLDCIEVEKEFHARFSAKQKIYCYKISRAPILHPHLAGLRWHIPRQFNIEELEAALALYKGTHNFKNLSALRGNETESTDYVRTLFDTSLTQEGQDILIHFQGNGFLYKMVRILTGAAMQVAQGRLRLNELDNLLDANHIPSSPPFCAPADGLTLEKVVY